MVPSYKQYIVNISKSGLSIYDPIEIGDVNLWIPTSELEKLLSEELAGVSLKGFPLRTRSKELKKSVCRALGYSIPSAFQKTHPRFPGQQLDTYIQKSNNLQIWNEELTPTRRYAIVKLNTDDVIEKVKVVTGETLAMLDKTGTLTQKYQARVPTTNDLVAKLVVERDTDNLMSVISNNKELVGEHKPTDYPDSDSLFSIKNVFEKVKGLVDATFHDTGYDQERNRGGELHKLVSKRLGYLNHGEDGRFPDIKHQLLEVKLQTSPTIDLGLVLPNSVEPLDVPKIASKQIRHCDVRYAIFIGVIRNGDVKITSFYLTTGESFFKLFQQFQGKVLNKKLQILLPRNFFD